MASLSTLRSHGGREGDADVVRSKQVVLHSHPPQDPYRGPLTRKRGECLSPRSLRQGAGHESRRRCETPRNNFSFEEITRCWW